MGIDDLDCRLVAADWQGLVKKIFCQCKLSSSAEFCSSQLKGSTGLQGRLCNPISCSKIARNRRRALRDHRQGGAHPGKGCRRRWTGQSSQWHCSPRGMPQSHSALCRCPGPQTPSALTESVTCTATGSYLPLHLHIANPRFSGGRAVNFVIIMKQAAESRQPQNKVSAAQDTSIIYCASSDQLEDTQQSAERGPYVSSKEL